MIVKPKCDQFNLFATTAGLTFVVKIYSTTVYCYLFVLGPQNQNYICSVSGLFWPTKLYELVCQICRKLKITKAGIQMYLPGSIFRHWYKVSNYHLKRAVMFRVATHFLIFMGSHHNSYHSEFSTYPTDIQQKIIQRCVF